MPTTPARTLRSNSSTPVSGNTAGSVSTRARRRNEQQLVEIKDNDDDDEEQFLQTQQPLPTQQERGDENEEDKKECEDYKEEEEVDDADEYEKSTNSQQRQSFSKAKRTARKTISEIGRKMTRVVEDIEKVEVEKVAVGTVKREVSEDIGGSEHDERTTVDTNMAKNRIHQYYYDIIDQEQHTILFEHPARITSWPVLQVSFITNEAFS